MLAKWKTLLTNWINCYFNDETTEKAQSVTPESLLCIITHLRENFSLDESKTSLLEAHTLEEFLSEKFTEFFFVNGTVSPSTEDEIYMVASLLLYFVCVTSKDVNLKNAMCQKLSSQDQETVLKFNRSLMENDCITRRDVETAILEACGQELASAGDLELNVLTTPPALRSLHGEVRRLQAALDAERFDRNFLQEELARSNYRIEKIAKEKEDYKLEITNLRAKVVDSAHEEAAPANQETRSSTKSLMKQIDELEQRMVDTRSLLEEITAERDTYKKKVEDLKVERDKWLTCSQEEAKRADEAQELFESERTVTESLKELIGELRSHNRQNGIDTSQLECDDPDATVHSFVQNASVCSDACANVIEVQLSEEKNKTASLTEKVQYLQAQIAEMHEKFQLDVVNMSTLEAIIRQRDTVISDLKHRLNEEIHEKNQIRTKFSEESIKLNNKINELEQQIKTNSENFYKAMECKLGEIQCLQEEKQSLVQSLSDQTTKLEGIIKSHETTINQLTDELYTEKNQMQKMKEDYETRMMKLNEKVLNRNNELVELQNNVCEKGDKIEALQMELKKERTQTENLIAKYNQDIEIANAEKAMLEAEFRQKVDVINEIQNQLQDYSVRSERLSEDLNAMKKINESLNAEINSLTDTREQLRNELMNRDCHLEQLQQNLKQLEYVLVEERKGFEITLYEKDVVLNELKNNYDSEMSIKTGLQEEVQQLYDARTDLTDELNRLSADLEKSRQVIHEKDRMIDAMDLYLNDEKSVNSTLRENCDELNLRINKLTNQLEDRQRELEDSQHLLCSEINSLKYKIDEGNNSVKTLTEQIRTLEQDNNELIAVNSLLQNEKDTMSKCLKEVRVSEESLRQLVDELRTENHDLQQKVEDSNENHNKHIEQRESEHKTLTTRVAELEKNIKDLKSKSKGAIKSKNAELENLQSSLAKSADELSSAKQHIDQMSQELDSLREGIMNNIATITAKDNEISNIRKKNEIISKNFSETNNELKKVRDHLEHEMEMRNAVIKQKELEIHDLQLELDQTKHKVNYQNDELQIKNVLCNELTQFKQTLEKTIEADRTTHEEIVKQYKDNLHKLEMTINEANNKINVIETEYNNTKMELTKQIEELKTTLQTESDKYSHVIDLKNELENQIMELENCLDTIKSKQNDNVVEKEELLTKLNVLEETLTKERETSLAKMKEYSMNKAALTQQLLEDSLANQLLAEEKSGLICEKDILTQQLLEGKSTIDTLLSENEQFKSEKGDIEKQLVTEKRMRDELEKEKCILVEQLSIQVSSNANLNVEIANKAKQIKFLEHENTLCLQKLATVEDLQNKLKDELNALVNDNKTLKTQLSDEEQKFNLLKEDKEILMNEKTAVLENMTEEKMLKDLIENEKNQQIAKLEDINEEVLKDLNSKTQEITQICDELQVLKHDYYDKQETIFKLSSLLSSGLTKLTSTLKIENALNDVFERFVANENCLEAPLYEQCAIIVNIAETLMPELISKELALNEEKIAGDLLKEDVKQKQTFILELQQLNKELNDTINFMKNDFEKKTEEYHATLEETLKTIKQLQKENQSLQMELNDVKIRLEVKVHSLKEKLVDNENLTEKLKNTYECQIQNLNVMSNKLTDYLKDKAYELDELRKEKDKLQIRVDDNQHVIQSLEAELKAEKQQQEKLINDFESERLVLKNMITVTESVMEDQKLTYDKTISDYDKSKQELHDENAKLKDAIKLETFRFETIIREKEEAFQILYRDFSEARSLKNALEKKVAKLDEEIDVKTKELKVSDEAYNRAVKQLKEFEKDITATVKSLDDKLNCKEDEFSKLIQDKQSEIQTLAQENNTLKGTIAKMNTELSKLKEEKSDIEKLRAKLEQTIEDNGLLLNQIKIENKSLNKEIEDNKNMILELEHLIKQLRIENEDLKANYDQYKTEIQSELEQKMQEITNLNTEIDKLRGVADTIEALRQQAAEKDEIINAVNNVLDEEKVARHNIEQDLAHAVFGTNQDIFKSKDNNSHASQETQSTGHHKHRSRKEHRDHQVDMSTSDLASSLDSNRTITDLEKIIHDKNRTITTLQSDITFMKSLMAESENKLLDVAKELEVSQENCDQLSSQLKKIVHQKNEEIADLKKQVSKMTVTENRASQIIKVSAKYQAIILKRIAEIKHTTALKELTNFGNSSVDNELRKSIADSVTMEDLENFLETTDRHLKRCSEKQVILQKERDRLMEVNRIHESEIINTKKFLTELSVSFKTLTSLKEMYTQKLSRVVSVQRTVRREILNLDGNVSSPTMCSLERGYAAAMQDMTECVMTLERWMERCIGRTISPEKIKQAFTSELDRVSVASGSFQNASLEVQLEELENSFQKLLEEVLLAQKAGLEKDAQAATVMEVRAEYEDKLNRMKAKMKQLYQEQISIFREKQKEEIVVLERELQTTQDKLAESSRAYEEHIRGLTTELWNVGEKFLVKKDEAEWLRRRQRHGSLMSLQNVPVRQDEGRPSDVSSLRSLPGHASKSDRRGLHMSDEEGEVFDNRYLRELNETPRSNRSPQPKVRLSELKWRNSLCPPHLKSSYPAEMQFSNSIHEEEIKCIGGTASATSTSSTLRPQRKEVGITAYKKPGPPTPSKQAGRLSATDCELRESLRSDPEPSLMRKTTTPSRIRSLFFSSRHDTHDGTPRKRLGIFRNKKQ